MKKLLSTLFIVFGLLLQTKLNAQQTLSAAKTEAYTNAVILSHYNITELQQIEIQDSTKFKTIVYYYTQSFTVEAMVCDECPVVNLNEVDISKYEYLRKKSDRYIRDFYKYGIKITLLSIDELTYKLPIHLQQ